MDCEHIFIFKNEKEHASCNGTHEVSTCLKCKINFHSNLLKRFSEIVHDEKFFNVPYPHDCVWDLKTGTCGNKLIFPKMPNGDEYGYERKSYGYLEIPEQRCCGKILIDDIRREINEIENGE